MCTERHSHSQPVHAVRQAVNSRRSDLRQRRPADRVCCVNTTERSSCVRWQIVDVDWRRRRLECSSWPDTLVLGSPDTDGPWQPACTPRVQERWASGVGRESALTDRGRTCECRWRGGPPHSGRVVNCPLCTGLDWIVQCFTSPPTQYRLYGRRFLQVKRPNQQYQSTEGTNTCSTHVLGCSVEHCVAVVHSRWDKGWKPPGGGRLTLDAHFWVKIGLKFQPWAKFQTFRHLTPSSFRSIPTMDEMKVCTSVLVESHLSELSVTMAQRPQNTWGHHDMWVILLHWQCHPIWYK